MASYSNLYQLIEERLDGNFPDFVAASLSSGKGWRKVAEDIEQATGCKVNYETLRGWFKHRVQIDVRVIA